MTYLIEGEVVDTYGGNFTYRDVWYEVEDGEITFFEQFYGSGSRFEKGVEIITDPDEITELTEMV